jgi:hypothetical protein
MYATGNSSQVAVFVSTTVSSTGFMASVTVAPFGGVVGLVNILLDQNELDVDVSHLTARRREVRPRHVVARLGPGLQTWDGYGLN